MAAYEVLFEALGDATRRQVLVELRRGPRSVQQIADRLPVSRPAVSQHLAVLRSAGLVVHRAVGTRRLYAIAPDGLAPLRAWLESFWSDALASFAQFAEAGDEAP